MPKWRLWGGGPRRIKLESLGELLHLSGSFCGSRMRSLIVPEAEKSCHLARWPLPSRMYAQMLCAPSSRGSLPYCLTFDIAIMPSDGALAWSLDLRTDDSRPGARHQGSRKATRTLQELRKKLMNLPLNDTINRRLSSHDRPASLPLVRLRQPREIEVLLRESQTRAVRVCWCQEISCRSCGMVRGGGDVSGKRIDRLRRLVLTLMTRLDL